MAGFGPTLKNREIAETRGLARLGEVRRSRSTLSKRRAERRAPWSAIGLMRQSSP